jgi:hypothetical protein
VGGSSVLAAHQGVTSIENAVHSIASRNKYPQSYPRGILIFWEIVKIRAGCLHTFLGIFELSDGTICQFPSPFSDRRFFARTYLMSPDRVARNWIEP